MRQFSSSRQPRRGQALLLAVLIMIFAALLSASFITVVSVNLNQTARQTDKNRAAASAKAGVSEINRQLAFSADGENWRPVPPPAPGTADYAVYYSPLDRAQGWAENGYAKFPNPLETGGTNNGPQFLAKVERIPFNTISTNREFANAGSLKVTIIGLSPEDPGAFSRTTFYKGGYQYAPIAQNMRVVSNWDFKNNIVPVAQASDTVPYSGNTTRIVTLKNIKGEFPEPPFAVMIGDPRTTTPGANPGDPGTPGTRGAVVIAKTANTFTFAHPGAAAVPVGLGILANERIELAASIGAPNGLDYNNTATPTPIATAIAVKVADNSTPGGVRVNGGLWLTGLFSADALSAPRDAYGPTVIAPATIKASGVFGRELSVGTNPVTRFNINGQGISGTANTDILSSDSLTFPNAWTLPTGYDQRIRGQLVSDGWNRLGGVPSGVFRPGTTSTPNTTGTREVPNFTPPAIDSGEGLERYRNLTRFSPPISGSASTSLYGNGQGIYIDNAQDKESAPVEDLNGNGTLDAGEDLNGNGTLDATWRDMTQAELVKMWISRPVPATATPDNYMRTGTPLATTIASASLEQQHIRSWVGPDEFRARGVEIELGNNSLAITRDARDDGPANVFGGVVAKTWKNITTGATQPGVYRRTFTWPANGVVFAEGNVRIRGNATNAPRSLTVVSMGNIYIEDSLSADADADGNLATPIGQPRKVLLLAKKNVVMNPTRVLGRPDAQTTVTAITPVTGGTQTLTVPEEGGLSFKIGDYVQSFATATGSPVGKGYVVAPEPTATIINLASVTGTISPGELLRTPSVVPQATTTTPFIPYSAIASPNDVIQRRFNTSTVVNPVRFAFDHLGDRPTAGTPKVFSVKTDVAASSNVFLSHKRIVAGGSPATTTTVSDLDKLIRGDYSVPTTGSDNFSDPAPTNQSTAIAQTLDQIKTAMNLKTHGTGANVWKYDTNYNPAYKDIPFFYLSGIGNRLEYGIASTATEKRETVNSTTTYDIPMATSVGLWLAGVKPIISNEYFNGTTYDMTTQFGFNPIYQDVSAGTATLPEDILTGDRSFYQSDAWKSTIDSRTLGATSAGSNSLVIRQSDNLIPLVAPATLPAYRLRAVKMENVAIDTASGTSIVKTIGPAKIFTINAYVYAQTGSWFVIPSGLFNDRLRGDSTQTYLDIDNDNTPDAGEYIDAAPIGYSAGDFADLNRNGTIENTEMSAMARYSRYNYQINFTGAIAEKQTPIINTMKDGSSATANIVATGAVSDWMLSWSTVNKTGAAAPTNGRMTYTFDSDYVRGQLQNDDGFRLPQTLEIHNLTSG